MAGNSSSAHVHFNQEDVRNHTEEIHVEPSPDGESVDMYLGFLQCGHVYQVEVAIKHPLGPGVTCKPIKCARLVSCNHKKGADDEFVFEVFANAEGLMLHTLRLTPRGAEGPGSLIVRFHARVLGHLKGTPGLKNGVKSIGLREADKKTALDEVSDSEL